MALNMEVGSEEDQMVRAIALSLGENVLMALDEVIKQRLYGFIVKANFRQITSPAGNGFRLQGYCYPI